jgi:hypothetical protein
MTKRSRDSITTSSHSEPSERHASDEVEGQDGPEGSALKKARSFMATLVGAQNCHVIYY